MTWHAAPSVGAVLSQANSLWPDRCRVSDGIVGDLRHKNEKGGSDHNPDSRGVVHAVDLTHGPYYKTDDVDCRKVADAIVARRDPRVAYIIFDGRICSSTISPWTWRPYNGYSAHREHLHISILHTGAAEADTSPWFSSAPAVPRDPTPVTYCEVDMSSLPVLTVTDPVFDDKAVAGNPVRVVQGVLMARGYLPMAGDSCDGFYGPTTAAAVKRFQGAHKLDADGACGPLTWDALLVHG